MPKRGGDVYIPISPSRVVSKVRNQLKGEIGEGGEAVVKLRSSNGSIRLKRQDAPQS